MSLKPTRTVNRDILPPTPNNLFSFIYLVGLFVVFVFVFETGSCLCSLGWPLVHYEAKCGLEFLILLLPFQRVVIIRYEPTISSFF